MFAIRVRPVAAVALLLVLPAGCARYQRAPLQLEQYAEAWPARQLDTPTVRAYATALARAEDEQQPFDPADGLSLAEAEAVALLFNPRLRLARAQADVPSAGAAETGWWPDPQFEVGVKRFVNPGSAGEFGWEGPTLTGVNAGIVGGGGGGLEITPAGFRRGEGNVVDDPWIVGADLRLTIPISGRLAVEQDWAWATSRSAWRRVLVAEWQLLTELRSAWLTWSTTQERIRVRTAYLDQLAGVATTASRLATAGELKPTDARLLLIEQQRQRAALIALAATEDQQRLELLALLGIAPHAPIELVPAVFLPEADGPSAAAGEALLARHPRVLAARAGYEEAEQRLRLETRSQYPDLNVGPGYSLEEGFTRLGMGLGLTLPLWNRNRQAIATARAARDEARVQAEAELEQALSELARAELKLEHARAHRQLLVEQVAPLVDQQLADTQQLLELGEVDVLLLRDALDSALETKLEIISATLTEAVAADALQQMLAPRWITPPPGPGRGDRTMTPSKRTSNSRRRMGRPAALPLCLATGLAVGLALSAGCRRDTAPDAKSTAGMAEAGAPALATNRIGIPPNVRQNLGITFVHVERRAVQGTVRIAGRFELPPEARRTHNAMLAGRVELAVRQFQVVKAGDRLYEMSSPQWHRVQSDLAAAFKTCYCCLPELDAARAALAETQAQITFIEQRVARLDQAGSRDVELEAELDRLRTAVPRLEAEVRAKEADMQSAQLAYNVLLGEAAALSGIPRATLAQVTEPDPAEGETLVTPHWSTVERITVRAETAGVVSQLGVTEQGWVEPGDLVLETVDPAQLRFHADALQTDINRFEDGQPAQIAPPPGGTINLQDTVAGHITVGFEAHSDERTVPIYLVPDELPRWAKAGVTAYLEVFVAGTEQPVLAIPESTVVRDGLERVFFRRDPHDPDQVIRVVADLGASDARWVEVKSGVRAGDEIVLGGVYPLMLASASGSGEEAVGHFHADGTFHERNDH